MKIEPDDADLEATLRGGFSRGLPGHDAQLLMAPRPRIGWHPGEIPDDARPGAGLLLLFPHGGQPHLVLTLRHGDLPQHAGQVSLPGGAQDPGESLVEAALRETHEEIGVEPSDVRIVGSLSPLHIPVSGFALHPFVAVTDHRPQLTPEAGEVEQILEVPLSWLRDRARIRTEEREFRGTPYTVPYFELFDLKVWGATAMILAEFLVLIGGEPGAIQGAASPRA